jgi:MerR family transcriptional regulator, light-induced transcriptional regulator
VKRWVDDGHITATRTAGGHRRIALHEAVRYMRAHGTAIVRPDLLGLPELTAAAGEGALPDSSGELLFEYLREGAAPRAEGHLLSSYLAGGSIAEIVDGPLSAAMERIGELWVSTPSGIYWEHRATQIAIQAIGRLRLLLSPPEGSPVAVGGAPSGDAYALPSLAVAAVLEGEGFRVANLGPNTPLSALALGVEDLSARLAWLSVSVAVEPDRLRRQVLALSEELAENGTVLVVGGAEAPRLSLPRGDSIYVGRSMAELEALVQGMRLAQRSVPA